MYACFAGNRPPEKPKFQRDQSAAIAFDGTVAARHTAADGSAEYVHLVFGSNAYSEGQGANIVDAEFLFLTGRYITLLCILSTTALTIMFCPTFITDGVPSGVKGMLFSLRATFWSVHHCADDTKTD